MILFASAKNRLNRFYNPKLYVAPAMREPSADDQIVVNMGGIDPPTPALGGIAGTGITMLVEVCAQKQLGREDHAQNDEIASFAHQPAVPGQLSQAVRSAKDRMANRANEIDLFQNSIVALDKRASETAEQRKEEHADLTELILTNTAAMTLLGFAKNWLNQSYNPKLHGAPAMM